MTTNNKRKGILVASARANGVTFHEKGITRDYPNMTSIVGKHHKWTKERADMYCTRGRGDMIKSEAIAKKYKSARNMKEFVKAIAPDICDRLREAKAEQERIKLLNSKF